MRFTSLFRIPRYQRFHIEPRYYDPIKEDIAQRVENMKKELESKADLSPSKIAFKRKAKLSQEISFIQPIIALFLFVVVLGWLEFGNEFFYYLLWVLIPAYLLFKIRKSSRRK